ncbi:MAG: YihY/virulence factor BrkB family protein, partial [Halococcoides sp.]
DAGEVGRDGEEAASGGTGGGGNDPDGGEDDSDPDGGDETPPDRQSIIRDQRAEIDRLRSELRDLEDRVDRKAVDREDLEGRLRRYVRWRQRRGYARSWGPYIVLLYGVILTLAAFYTSHLYGGWTILAMLVIWLSTLGLYALMVIVGMTLTGTSWLGLARDALQQRR